MKFPSSNELIDKYSKARVISKKKFNPLLSYIERELSDQDARNQVKRYK